MSQLLVPVSELPVRFPELLRALVAGGRVGVLDGGAVVAELVRPQTVGPALPPADAAVAEIVRDMIAAGHPPEPDSPLWRYVPRAA